MYLVSEILGTASIKVASWYIHTEPIQPPGTIHRIYITAMSAFWHMPQVGRVQCISLLVAWFDSGNRDRGRVRIIIEPVHKVRAMAQHGIVIEIALGGDFMGFD